MGLTESVPVWQQNSAENAEEDTQKQTALKLPPKAHMPEQMSAQPESFVGMNRPGENPPMSSREVSDQGGGGEGNLEKRSAVVVVDIESLETLPLASQKVDLATIETRKIPAVAEYPLFTDLPTTPMVATPPTSLQSGQEFKLTRGKIVFLALLLTIVIINATSTGFSQFFGPQGWGSVFDSSNSAGGQSLLKQIGTQLSHHTPIAGATAQATPVPLTPQQIVDALLSEMTLDEKLGQMLMVRFNDQSYLPDIDAMIRQYKVGAVIDFQGNIASKSQITALNAQMQQNAYLPLIIAVDQEGGTVDRLANLDGPQPSAFTLGATGNPTQAYQQGLKDAGYLATYGFNLNLAPVADVTNVYNPQLVGRTYGTSPTTVSKMAGAYLQGLQHSGKVVGTLKHFPGLGDTSTDPHSGLPYLTRPLASLNAIDWAPYKSLLSQGDVYAIMVTHELVQALDPSIPSSLSSKVVSILRHQLGFQGVIITDGLTMDAILGRYTLGEAAAMAVEAGDDLMMDPASPNEVAQMINGIKQAISSGAISQQRIDASVRRILLLKYQMGLLHIS